MPASADDVCHRGLVFSCIDQNKNQLADNEYKQERQDDL